MDALTEESASPGTRSVVGIDKGWMCGSHASRPFKCVPHCQGDKNSLLDEIFQGPRGLCERGALALLCSRWLKVLKARTLAHGTSAVRGRS